jgi:hypothetical protein
MLDLRDLQILFWQAIAAEPAPCGSRPVPAELLRDVLPGPRLAPAERLNVYAGMYFWRLHEVLREDFARVAAVAGTEVFERLVSGYLARHPSSHPSVRELGREFAAFLSERADPALPAFLPDLARLEWARVEVFDAPDATALRAADLAGVAAEDWPELRLAAVPALEVVDAAWPVHRIWSGDDASAPEPTTVRVWRDGFLVFHASMDAREAAAVKRLAAGTTFGEVCELCETPEQASALLARWLEDGLLCRL